jgi:uncharacterized membrane protein YkoI
MMSQPLCTACKTALAALLLMCVQSAWANIGADDAAATAVRATGGRVLSVDRAGGQRPAWRVKVVTPRGEVRVVLIDAATGQPI